MFQSDFKSICKLTYCSLGHSLYKAQGLFLNEDDGKFCRGLYLLSRDKKPWYHPVKRWPRRACISVLVLLTAISNFLGLEKPFDLPVLRSGQQAFSNKTLKKGLFILKLTLLAKPSSTAKWLILYTQQPSKTEFKHKITKWNVGLPDPLSNCVFTKTN